MSEFRWDFTVNANDAKIAQQNLTVLNQTINNYQKTTLDAARATQTWFEKWTRNVGIFNTWNKGIRFLVDDIQLLGKTMTGWLNQTIKIGGAFESAGAELRAYFSEGEEGYGKIMQEAIRLGDVTMFTAQQAVAAASELKKAGQSGEEIQKNMGAVLSGAQATGVPMEKVANIMAVTQAQFARVKDETGKMGVTGEEALKALAGAANASTTDLYGMAAAMNNAAPAAALLGINLTDTSTILAMFANNGITYSKAGSQLNTALTRLSAPSKQAQEALKKLNIDVKSLNLADPVSWIRTFNTALQQVPTQAEKIALLKPIFGAAATAMIPVIEAVNETKGGFDAMRNSILAAGDSMGTVGAIKANTMSGAMEMMKSSAEGVWVRMGQIIKVPVRDYFNGMADIINSFNTQLDVLSQRFGANANTIEEWGKIIKEQGFKGVFDGLIQDLKPKLATMKTLFGIIWMGIKEAGREIWAFLGSAEVKAALMPLWEQFKNGMRELEGILSEYLFSPANVTKAKDFGIAVGKEIIAGITSTNIGRVLLAMFAAKQVGSAVVNGLNTAATVAAITKKVTTSAVIAPAALTAAQKTAAATIGQSLNPAAAPAWQALPKAAAVAKAPGVLATQLGTGFGMSGGALAGTAAIGAAAAVIIGKTLEAEIEKAARGYEGKQSERGAKSYADEIKRLTELKKTTADPEKLARINAALDLWSAELDKIVGESKYFQDAQEEATKLLYDFNANGGEGDFVDAAERAAQEKRAADNTKAWLDPVVQSKAAQIQGDADKRAYIEQSRKAYNDPAMRKNQQAQADQIKAQAMVNVGQAPDLETGLRNIQAERLKETARKNALQPQAAPDYAALKTEAEKKDKALQNDMSLVNATDDYQQKLEQSKNIISEMKLQLIDTGKEFAKWLLEPVNQFNLAWADVKLKFGDLVQSLKSKSVDIGEKFGLTTKEGAKGQRAKILEDSIALTQEQILMAQTPEQKAKMQERLADQFTQQAELTGNKDSAKKAQAALEEAQTQALEQQKLEARKIELDRKATQESIPILEGMLNNTETAGGKASILERLQKSYMDMGDVEKASSVTKDLMTAQMHAAEENAKNSKQMVEHLKNLVDIAMAIAKMPPEETDAPDPLAQQV